ncbi:Na/Pi cotransporter family protein [Seongchinamella sediminis]|uniref:Na/Pi cotransporter family protein n=1 Tax=Seongchinamella sediminis TaxID=2283635 RepID=A0A3L7DU52_9GAMM|nr:Na/Pi symporter [Seongchinamella sediminis]RLQ21108.1 Na/Pi cotransporter family protein [Seongchinamella sediminis]
MLGRIFLPTIFLVLAYGFWTSSNFKDIAAGVALFLFGMLCMEQGFKAFSGGTLQRLLSASTDRLWKSLSFGVVSTTLMQSSSLVSVITISFLSAEIIGLAQGIGIIFGANLGTTTGAWIVAGFGLKVNISAYAMPILVFGVLFLMQSSARIKGLGWILVGIGFLFLGIHFMKEGFSAYADQIDLTRYALPGIAGLLAFTLIGILATVVMQSSHATLTLTITALAAGQVTYDNALALAIGGNVGTTITALLGSISANISGKRLAAAHVIFNVVTGVLALVFIQPLLQVVEYLSEAVGIAADDYTLKLAVFHSLFNVIGVMIMVPLLPRLVRFLEQHLQGPPMAGDQPRYLSKASLELPEIASQAVYKETLHLLDNAFSLIAHGVDLRRSLIFSEVDMQPLLERTPEQIEIDLDRQYALMIKDIYSANIEFISRAQAAAPAEYSDQYSNLRRANMDTVAAIKATKHLRKNLQVYSRDRNPDLRREYNRFRIRVGGVLRELGALRETDDPVVILLSLDQIKVASLDAANFASATVDKLIRERTITSKMATSLINDGAYTRELVARLIEVVDALARASMPPGEVLGEEMSLQIEEIADIARRLDGGALAAEGEDEL